MYILSPKSNFLGGALVSASHLGKLFPDVNMKVWKYTSPFLTLNKVKYDVIDGSTVFDKTVWCNDTCVDKGYYPNVKEENYELWNYLQKHDKIIFVNHQPINRYKDYLIEMLRHLLQSDPNKEITILNYRACWNTEWENEMSLLFPTVKVTTLPYHYYLSKERRENLRLSDALANWNGNPLTLTLTFIGRSKSNCKVSKFYDWFVKKGIKTERIEPDNSCPNEEFLDKLNNKQVIMTGYYYGFEGNPEIDTLYNHLEWSYMDALFAGCFPVTSSLFGQELDRLNLPGSFIGYLFQPYMLDQLSSKMQDSFIENMVNPLKDFICNYDIFIQRFLKEIDHGNLVIRSILKNY